jgi:uncharacterized damage-inducible protein DinB
MSDLTDHARSMVAHNTWANNKILDAAAGLSPEAFAAVGPKLAHTVATQIYWHANWTGGEFTEPAPDTPLDALRVLFASSNAALQSFADALTDAEWNRSEAWWKRWGYDAKSTVGKMLFQVVYHGIQHRAEVAVVLTDHGCSPGDLDYLAFLPETSTLP